MAMESFVKLFQQKCRSKQPTTRWHVPHFSKDNVNLLLFTDNTGERSLILDSRCMKEWTIDDFLCQRCSKLRDSCKKFNRSKCSKCQQLLSDTRAKSRYRNICRTNKSDTSQVGEMIFGTAPLPCANKTIKIHSLKNPHQLMLTCVFPYTGKIDAPQCSSFDFDMDSLDDFDNAIFNTSSGLPRGESDSNLSSRVSTTSQPVEMSSVDDHSSVSSLSLSVSSVGNSSQPSPVGSYSDPISACSRLNMMRRLRNSKHKSFTGSLNESIPPPSRRRTVKIGLSVVITVDEFADSYRHEFEIFFFSHMTLIENQLTKLRIAVEQEACKKSGKETIMEAFEVFRDNFYDLYSAKPLPNPVWLSMMEHHSLKDRICQRFISEFATLVTRYDQPTTDFFVSTLLTGVLMNHLAWVPTVTPSGEAQSAYSEKHSAKWLDMLAKSHPYNPLWAQLSDLYGAIGIPPKLSRTIITGRKKEIVMKFLFMLTYFIRCSEIHESLEECYDDAFVLSQIHSATKDEICVDSMEKDAFVVVDAVSTNQAPTSDSGHVSYSTVDQKSIVKSTNVQDSESGIVLDGQSICGGDNIVTSVPNSSPVDKVLQWINTSHVTAQAPLVSPSSDSASKPTSLTIDTSDPPLHKSRTDSTLVAAPSPRNEIMLSPDPRECRVETVTAVGRSTPAEIKTESWEASSGQSLRTNLRRMFSSEIEEFDQLYYNDDVPSKTTARPLPIDRQISHLSELDEYFDDGELDSCSQVDAQRQGRVTPVEPTTPSTPTRRDVLFKVPKASGYQHQTSSVSTEDTKTLASRTISNSSQPQPLDLERQRHISLSKQSSRCSTPQTINNGPTTPTLDHRLPLSCQTIQSDSIDEHADPFINYKQLNLPRSQSVHRQADTSISTTSFGRRQLIGFSEHYMSDFVLHGTSDTDVLEKVQPDLSFSVEHCVLEDRITEAVAVVGDTESWSVKVASSMRTTPKKLEASQLVRNMVEVVVLLAKLNMAPEFVLMHMEDRLQEMLFKSRMVASYVSSQKRVDMDELNAMFGLETSDIKFLLAIAATHSTVNVEGIF